MEKVKILKTFHVDHSGITYQEGAEAELSNELAHRHGENGTGFLKIIKDVPEKPKLTKDK
jgi:hypothetical protein